MRVPWASTQCCCCWRVQGAQSSCCEQCLDSVVAGGVCVTFHPVSASLGMSASLQKVASNRDHCRHPFWHKLGQ